MRKAKRRSGTRGWTSIRRTGYAASMVAGGSSGGGDKGAFTGRAALGYDHGYDGEVFYLGLALDPAYIEGFVDGALERIGEDDPDEEDFLRGIWEDGDDQDFVVEALKSGVEVRSGRPPG